MKTIWNKETGAAREYESVDAREILKNSDLYTDVNPKAGDPKDPDRDGFAGAPQNVANVENEFRREPVGDNPPAKDRDQVIIRNPVTDQPRMAPRAGTTDEDRRAKDEADRLAKIEADRLARTHPAMVPANRLPPPAGGVNPAGKPK